MELVTLVCSATAAGFVQENLYPCQPAARHIGLLGTGLSSTPIAQLSPPASLPHVCPSMGPAQTKPGALQSWQWLVATSWLSAALTDVSCGAVHKEQSLTSHQRDSKGSLGHRLHWAKPAMSVAATRRVQRNPACLPM